MFTPKWKKEAQNFYKSGKKFLNFKRDLLKEDRIKEIESRLRDLKTSMKGRGQEAQEKTKEAIRQLDNTCEQSLPRQHRSNPIGENIESLFVTLVIVIGVRCYFAQPFIIPTGSMQPTLNGVICQSLDKEEWANPAVRIGEKVLRGRSYVHKIAPVDLVLPRNFDASKFMVQNPGPFKLIAAFHVVTKLQFENKTITAHNLPASAFYPTGEFSFADIPKVRLPNGKIIIPKGTVLYSGYADSGDVLIADKVSYHFRKPKRGEAFIFDTRDLKTDGSNSRVSSLSSQQNAQHYIKRCVGVPGDTLQINSPNLLVNGEVAKEPYMRRVMEREGAYAGTPGYVTASLNSGFRNPILRLKSDELVLKDSKKKPWKAEYAAMGDNTENSLDSRYWGSVKEYNIVAPAFFTLWPFTTGHWGLVK